MCGSLEKKRPDPMEPVDPVRDFMYEVWIELS